MFNCKWVEAENMWRENSIVIEDFLELILGQRRLPVVTEALGRAAVAESCTLMA